MKRKLVITISLLLLSYFNLWAQPKNEYTSEDLIYGYRDGLALTMKLLKPAKTNGRAIISVVSGNWVSTHDWDEKFIERAQPFLQSGYTVFLTFHSSAPRFAIPDAIEDIKRAVQFVRSNSANYHITPGAIGITGTSSGGQLALAISTADDIKNLNSKDPIERVSSKVQAVAVFCPPTDFLNFGNQSFKVATQTSLLEQLGILGAFTYTKWDSVKNIYLPVTNEKEKLKIDSLISPAEMVTADDAPTYIIHGDSDKTVPIQQSQFIKQKLENVKVPVVLIVKPGADDGWKGMVNDEAGFITWFNKYLILKN